MRYAEVQTFVHDNISADASYTGKMPVFNPGPATDQILQKAGPNRLVFLMVGGGAARTVEGLFDQPFITVRTYGNQNSFVDAENLAWRIDGYFMAADHNTKMGTRKVLRVARSGGCPQLLGMDSASRYYFECTYIAEAQSEG